MKARGPAFTVQVMGPEHVVVTFRLTPQARRGQAPVVDRRGMWIDKVMFQLAGVLRRLRIGETFYVWLDQKPSPQLLNVLKSAGAVVEPDRSWAQSGYRLSITWAHPLVTARTGSR